MASFVIFSMHLVYCPLLIYLILCFKQFVITLECLHQVGSLSLSWEIHILIAKANDINHRCSLNTDSVRWYWINYGPISKTYADFMFVFPDMYITAIDASIKYFINIMTCYTNMPRFRLWICFPFLSVKLALD